MTLRPSRKNADNDDFRRIAQIMGFEFTKMEEEFLASQIKATLRDIARLNAVKTKRVHPAYYHRGIFQARSIQKNESRVH
jgi:Asp-tRNA(Asn)/Glu-tRNA(Gln) amidotransferase C subunit